MIMSYFTTNKMTPLEVHELGKKQLNVLYPMVRYTFYSGRAITHYIITVNKTTVVNLIGANRDLTNSAKESFPVSKSLDVIIFN